MDIAPPPSFVDNPAIRSRAEEQKLKKKLKRARYKSNKRDKKEKEAGGVEAETQSSDKAPSDQDQLHVKFQQKMRGLQNARSGESQKQMEAMRSKVCGQSKKVNPYTLMDKLGLKDPAMREKVVQVAKSGNTPSLERYIQNLISK